MDCLDRQSIVLENKKHENVLVVQFITGDTVMSVTVTKQGLPVTVVCEQH